MSDEATLKLAEAMDRLAAAIERVSGPCGFGQGLQVSHHGFPSWPSQQPPYSPYQGPFGQTWGKQGQ